MNKKLSELGKGDTGIVTGISGAGEVNRRIVDMGLHRGVEIKVERVAPLGDPVEIFVKGYHLSLRKEEAENVEIEVK